MFLGRVDRQVKINGLRIELGEIEARLGQIPGARGAIVDVWQNPAGHRSLVAWTPRVDGTPPPDAGQVRERLAADLPSYMLPSHVVAVDEIPLTASGKVDRARLPDPDPGQRVSTAAPRDDTEKALAEKLFAPVLGLATVGVHDNFFDLGGSSLQAAQLTAGITAMFDAEVSLTEFFTSPLWRIWLRR